MGAAWGLRQPGVSHPSKAPGKGRAGSPRPLLHGAVWVGVWEEEQNIVGLPGELVLCRWRVPRGGEESVWATGTWPGRGPTPVAEAQQHPDRPLSQCFHLCHFESFVCVCPRLLLCVFVFAKLTDLRSWPCLCLGPGAQPGRSRWQPCMRPCPSLSLQAVGRFGLGPHTCVFSNVIPLAGGGQITGGIARAGVQRQTCPGAPVMPAGALGVQGPLRRTCHVRPQNAAL